MRYLYMNYPLHHFENKFLLRGINVLIRLISMSSILELIFSNFLKEEHIIQLCFTFVIMPIIMFIFVFIMSDIIFNEFIYERNKFILDTHRYLQSPENMETMFPNPVKLIWNTTRDKFSNMSSTTKITNKDRINRMNQYTNQLKLIINSCSSKKCNITRTMQLKLFNDFSNLLNSYLDYEIISKKKFTNLAIKWDKIDWIQIKYDLTKNRNLLKNEDLNELIFFLNYYKNKISNIFLL